MGNSHKLKKGDIVWCVLHGKDSVQDGIRPCLVLGNKNSLYYSTITQVIPISSKIKKTELPVHVVLENVLPQRSVLLTEQVQTVSKNAIKGFITSVGDSVLDKIKQALLLQLGF